MMVIKNSLISLGVMIFEVIIVKKIYTFLIKIFKISDYFLTRQALLSSSFMCFRNLIGIRIWFDTAFCMANLFSYYERKRLLQAKTKTKKEKKKITATMGPAEVPYFKNIFWLTDNLWSFRSDEFENSFNDIYPKELELKKEKDHPCNALFLDLSLKR